MRFDPSLFRAFQGNLDALGDVVDANDGVTTLREAINQANAAADNDLPLVWEIIAQKLRDDAAPLPDDLGDRGEARRLTIAIAMLSTDISSR